MYLSSFKVVLKRSIIPLFR